MSRLKDAVGKRKPKKKKRKVEVDESAPPSRSRARRRAMPAKPRQQASSSTSQPAEPKDEPEAVKLARARIRKLLRDVAKDAPKSAIGLVLAIVNQETGSHSAANALIDEMDLQKTFGIRKF